MHLVPHLKRALSFAVLAALAVVLGFGPADAAEKRDKAKSKPAAKSLVSSLAGRQIDSTALAHHIDDAIDARLQDEKTAAAAQADDAEFLRRVYLDIVGRIPPGDKTAAFLASREPDKRARLIDELLHSEEFGKHQADIWQALLLPRNSDNRAVPYDAMTKWLAEGFNESKSWDRMAREIVTASGDADSNPAISYIMANRGPDKLTDNVTRMFLGVQLQCAQCHNHPFTTWKQEEYWGMAAFFSKVRLEGNPRAAAAKGKQTASIGDGNKGRPLPKPESAKTMPPKFLQGEVADVKGSDNYRKVLADWMTSRQNPYFSKAMVNRTWAQFFGRGLVAPVDDMHDGNPASHPQLLVDLADQFAANEFDLKYLIRAICNSKTYQRTSKVTPATADTAPELFGRMAVKVQSPEQLFDSLVQVLGAPGTPNQPRRPAMGAARGPVTARQQFVNFFKVEDADPTEYQVGIQQALRLMNSPQTNNAGVLNSILKGGKEPTEVIEQLYLKTLSRRPTEKELERLTAHVARAGSEPRPAYADILWSLLNCSEFAVNH
jgi:hypothetical protein